MGIELLTASAGDYVDSQGRELKNYIMKGFSATEISVSTAERVLMDNP